MESTLTENRESNGQAITTKVGDFETIVTNLNADRKGFNFDDIADAIKKAIVGVVELEITTWVSEPSPDLGNELLNRQEIPKSGNRMHTVINMVNGDIQNEVGSQFVGSGPYAELREFHLSQVKESKEIIQKNIETVHKIYDILVEISKSRKNTQESGSRF
ncbi:hypothetical protein I8752_14730 [Nostocaceae cyanobacterium CENA369]|uniref:Uncharacterized protein n=1 Tax=Dendronalium phyllosphericum CENA369 TaxID=1725256 RepID=A0A8J7I6T2_9NOST|nr:hypothetical protein [Dendronalium phyllosphericum]MBH8574250.1 hypothetical protein [Dendronalium phyllosphericum CENA369]